MLPFRIILSFYKTNILINDFEPDIVIGTGGYASALPLLVASKNKKGISIILQEQNSFPGITTKWFSRRAKGFVSLLRIVLWICQAKSFTQVIP